MLPVVSEASLDTYVASIKEYEDDRQYLAECLEIIKRENPNLFLIIMFYLDKLGGKYYNRMGYGMCAVYMMLKNQAETDDFVKEMENS